MAHVNGSLFKRAMENNFIKISNGVMQVHSYDKNGYGIYRKEQMLDADPVMAFAIGKRDMDAMTSFGDIEMEIAGNTISCRSGSSRFRMQIITDIFETNPKISGMQTVNITLSDFLKAAALLAKDDGITFSPDAMIAYNAKKSLLYRLNKPLGVDKVTIVPPDIAKEIIKGNEYSVKTNGNYLLMQSETEIVYSGVLQAKVEKMLDYDPHPEGTIDIEDWEEFANHIKIAKRFGEMIRLEIVYVDGQKKMRLTSICENDPRSYEVDLDVTTNIKEYALAWNTDTLLMMIDTIRADGMLPKMTIDSRMMRIENTNEICIMAGIRDAECKAMVLEGKKENDRNEE